MPQSLRDSLVKDLRNNGVLIIAGAGVSAAATDGASTATWKGLLRHGLERCLALDSRLTAAWKTRVIEEIDSDDLDDLLSAAEKVSRKLEAPASGEWSRWLREAIGELAVSDPALPLAIASLGAPVATTNYDTVLDEAVGGKAATWQTPNSIQRIVRGEDISVAHLHGVWDQPESVILGIRSYEELIRNEPAQGIQRALSILRSFLFIGVGAGMEDPNWSALRDYLSRVAKGSENRHYRLCLESELPELTPSSKVDRILPISYGQTHSDLIPFIRQLAVDVGRVLPEDVAVTAELNPGPSDTAAVARVAIGLIMHEDNVVLVQRRVSEGALEWQFPAGFVKPLRDPAEAIRDEVSKETGLTCKVGRDLGERIHPDTKMTCVYFELSILHGNLRNGDSNENLDVRWVPIDRIFEYIDEARIFPEFASRLRGKMPTP